jgi:hypothetical protein
MESPSDFFDKSYTSGTETQKADTQEQSAQNFELKPESYGNGKPRRVVIRGKISGK